MMIAEYSLTDHEWQRVAPVITHGYTSKRYHARDLLNAILYVIHTECPWRKLPVVYPKSSTVFHYYQRWQKDGTLGFVLAELASYRRAHPEAASQQLAA
jgi:transposase